MTPTDRTAAAIRAAVSRIALIEDAEARDVAIDAFCEGFFAEHGRHVDNAAVFVRVCYARSAAKAA